MSTECNVDPIGIEAQLLLLIPSQTNSIRHPHNWI